MNKRPLKDLFDAMYHGKPDFRDFLTTPLSENYEVAFQRGIGKNNVLKPTENLKLFQRFLNLFLIEFLPINERVVFSYRKGYSAINAVQKHAHSRYFFQTDISSFFDSVHASLVKRVIMHGASHSPIADVNAYIDRIVELVCVNDSLPVGFPASAPLSNCVLYQFDNELERQCNERNFVYSRYADDIIISGPIPSELTEFQSTVENTLHAFGSDRLSINKAKTKFFQVGNKVKILGLMILPNGKISADTKKRREVEILLYFYLKDREKFKSMVAEARARAGKNPNVSEDEYLDVLSGSLNYVTSIDSEYTDKLRKKFGAATIDMLIHKNSSNRK